MTYRIYLLMVYKQFLTLLLLHYDDVITGTIASQITSLTSVYSTVYSGADQSKHQSSASLAFVWGIHRGPVNSPHKWPVTRKMFPFDDVIMISDWRRCNSKYNVSACRGLITTYTRNHSMAYDIIQLLNLHHLRICTCIFTFKTRFRIFRIIRRMLIIF